MLDTALIQGCEYLTEFACEHSTLHLECPVGDTITIIGANYGRQESNICTHQSNTNCLSSNSKTKVEARCNGHRTCAIGATNGEFGGSLCRNDKIIFQYIINVVTSMEMKKYRMRNSY
ncbi:Calcium-independent receptor for alpha-latrotoxin [Carabus blaptoides fortunei]